MRKARTLSGDELLSYAMRLLAARGMAAAEVRAKLLRKAADAAEVDGVIAKLHEYGCLDDARFAEGYAIARRDSGGFGPARVQRDLRQRMVSPTLAGEAVRQVFAETDEEDLAARYLERKFRGVDLQQHLADPKRLAAAYRRLRHAGFSSPVSVRLLRRYAERASKLEDDEGADE